LDLPPNLVQLELPSGYLIKTNEKIRIPESLTHLTFNYYDLNYTKFLIPPNKRDLFQCPIVLQDIQELLLFFESMSCASCITKIRFDSSKDTIIPHGVIPNHIKEITLNGYQIIEGGAFPVGLEKLSIDNENDSFIGTKSFFQQLPHLKQLKELDIQVTNLILEKNMLPPTLEILDLKSTKLQQPIGIDVLPTSLTKLSMLFYNHALQPFVLPNGLKELYIPSFDQPFLKNSLPTSLTKLTLKRNMDSTNLCSFQDVDILDKLVYLSVGVLQASVSRVISNCKSISLRFNSIDPEFTLQDTTIEKLILYRDAYGNDDYNNSIPLSARLIPHKLERLVLSGFTLPSFDIIPKTCIYFKTDILNFNRKLLPPSIIMFRSFTKGENFRYKYQPYYIKYII